MLDAYRAALAVYSGDHVQRMELPTWLDPAAHYVYVAWASDDLDDALYVGVTSRLWMRLAQHLTSSVWAADADHIDLYKFASRREAEIAERDLIIRLWPSHNVSIPWAGGTR